MEAIILDISTLISYPKLLASQKKDVVFFTTTDVLAEIGNFGKDYHNINNRLNGLLDLIHTASIEKTLTIKNVEVTKKLVFFNNTSRIHNLTYAEASLIELGKILKNDFENVYLATSSEDLQGIAEFYKIKKLEEQKIESLIQSKQTFNKVVEVKAKAYENSIKNKLFLGIMIGCIATILVFSIYFNFQRIVQTINIWGTMTLTILLGIGLFIFREKQKFSYGVFEFLSGIATIIIIFYPNFDFNELTYSFNFYAKLLGGLYIMVRGQDNIVKSLQGKKAGFWLKEKVGIG